MNERTAFICVQCAHAENAIGIRTTEACIAAARAHGCYAITRPKGKQGKALLKFYLPRVLTAQEWRTVYDNLDRPLDHTPMCRSARGSCGHVEPVHQFYTGTQPFCDINCARCAR